MVRAFVMVKAAAGAAEDVVTAVRDDERVREAHVVAGEYDVIAEVEAEEVYEVLQTVSDGIRSLDGVADTRTYIAMG
ncbi:MAG: Lrp/AsnC ligand binding domain-containing protein [Haloferacaceae archaeon]